MNVDGIIHLLFLQHGTFSNGRSHSFVLAREKIWKFFSAQYLTNKTVCLHEAFSFAVFTVDGSKTGLWKGRNPWFIHCKNVKFSHWPTPRDSSLRLGIRYLETVCSTRFVSVTYKIVTELSTRALGRAFATVPLDRPRTSVPLLFSNRDSTIMSCALVSRLFIVPNVRSSVVTQHY